MFQAYQSAVRGLGNADEIKQVVDGIGPGAALHFVESAGHGFSVPDRPDQDVHTEVARAVTDWISQLI